MGALTAFASPVTARSKARSTGPRATLLKPPVALGKHIALLRGDLRLQFRHLGITLRKKIESAGVLADLERSALRWRATRQGKAGKSVV